MKRIVSYARLISLGAGDTIAAPASSYVSLGPINLTLKPFSEYRIKAIRFGACNYVRAGTVFVPDSLFALLQNVDLGGVAVQRPAPALFDYTIESLVISNGEKTRPILDLDVSVKEDARVTPGMFLASGFQVGDVLNFDTTVELERIVD